MSRSHPIALTADDEAIWRLVCVHYWHRRYKTEFCAELAAANADRYDYEIMLVQMRLSRSLKPAANYIRLMDLRPDLCLDQKQRI